MQVYLSPRSRPVYYYDVGSLKDIEAADRSQTSKTLKDKMYATGQRLIQENMPAVAKVAKLSADPSFVLPGVQSFSWGYAREVTEEYGLQSYMLLPWYAKAVTLTVKGKYYLGAFNTATSVVTSALSTDKNPVDYFRGQIAALDTRLGGMDLAGRRQDSYTDTYALASKIQVGQPGDPGGLTLIGFIRGCDVDESVTSPYVQNYTLSYLGVDMEWYKSIIGRSRAVSDNTIQKSNVSMLNG